MVAARRGDGDRVFWCKKKIEFHSKQDSYD